MRDPERVRRSNIIIIGLAVLMLIYGAITRIQSGESSFYLFGMKFDMPFATQQEVQEEAPETEAAEETGK